MTIEVLVLLGVVFAYVPGFRSLARPGIRFALHVLSFSCVRVSFHCHQIPSTYNARSLV